MTLEYVNSTPWTLNKVRISVCYSYIQAKLGNLGGYILSALCVGIIIRPDNICRKHLFIPILFPKITIHSNTIIENTNTIQNILIIHIDTILYLYRH